MTDQITITEEAFRSYSDVRTVWAEAAQDDRRFRLGEQWTEEELARLQARNQAPIVVNRVHPAVEAAKAMLTANRPSFRVSPREDSDNETAQAINGLLQYIWQVNDSDTMMRQVIDDYYVTGLGAVLVYVDPTKDFGRGEVCLKDIDPLTVYIDPRSRDRFGDDAEHIIISYLVSKASLLKSYPQYAAKIKKAGSSNDSDMPSTELGSAGTYFPEDESIMALNTNDELVRLYMRFTKDIVSSYRVLDNTTGVEDVYSEKEFTEFLKKPAWVINGEIYTSEETAQEAYQMALQQAQAAAEQVQMQNQQSAQETADSTGEPVPIAGAQVQEPEVQNITMASLVHAGIIDFVKIDRTIVRQYLIIGQTMLNESILEIDHYPIVFFMNLHNRTPFPISDVRMVRSLQEEINKTRSLIIAHATTSTTNKLILQTGSADMHDFEDRWASPTSVMEADLTAGDIQVIQPAPLPGDLYQKETMAKADIDHQMGLYEFMMGNAQNSPQTYRATISIDEFGQRRIKSKLMDIESGLKRLGEIVVALMQKLYTTEKIVRVIQPNNSMSEYMVNKRMYDDYGRVIGVLNNIMVGRYDVIVVTGSTLPTNRFAQLEFYMEAYEKGIIDRQEVLKKTEIFDQEGVMQRTDLIQQLQQQIQQQEEEIKGLKGDLQTAQREAMHAKQETELARFKSSIDSNRMQIDHSTKLYGERLNDEMSVNRKKMDLAIKEAKIKNRDTRKSGSQRNK